MVPSHLVQKRARPLPYCERALSGATQRNGNYKDIVGEGHINGCLSERAVIRRLSRGAIDMGDLQ